MGQAFMKDENDKKMSSHVCLDEAMKEKFKSNSIVHLLNKDDFVFQASTPKKFFYILLTGRVFQKRRLRLNIL